MKVSEVMTTEVATVRSDASLAEAACIMIKHRISGLPVVDVFGQLVGVITEGDFLRRGAGIDPDGSAYFWAMPAPKSRPNSYMNGALTRQCPVIRYRWVAKLRLMRSWI